MGTLPKQPTGEIGVTGLEDYNGIIQQEFLTDLRMSGYGKGYKIYDEMRKNSPVIGSLLNAIKQSILGVDWTFTSEEGEDDPRLELIEESLDNMDFTLTEHMTEALTMLDFGFALFEEVFERKGGKLLWKKFAFRGQDTVYRWLIDNEKDKGKILGFEQQTARVYKPTPVPMSKCLHYRTSKERNNPEGISILRPAYTSYYYAKNITAIEAIGIERDLVGIPVISMPEGSNSDPDSDDYKEAAQLVRRVRQDEQSGIVLAGGYDFRLVSAESTRVTDTGGVISRHEKRMLMSSLAQFLVLGMDQVGAMSLSEDQTDFFNMSVNTFSNMVADTFTRQAVRKLMVLNGYDPDGIRLEHSIAGDVSMEKLTKALQQATGLITWTPQDEISLRSIMGLPELSVEEIEAEQEKKQQREMDIIAGNMLPQNNDGQNSNDGNNNNEEQFSAKVEQEGLQDKWTSKLMRFFKGQQKRIVENVTK